jgi:hypothetical protein
MVIVSAIRLYGSETWLITKRIEDLLTSFHNRCARTIGKTFIRKTGGDEWVYPSLAETLKQAHLRPLRYYYLLKTRVKNYAETQDLYKDGNLWAQYNQLEHESDPEFTLDCERNLNEQLDSVVE